MSNGAGGGVRNLRAMFESNSQPASPDVRGRSPGARSNGDTSRPLSKVRTNFVSVEALKRARNDTPEQGASDSMHRRESFSLNENRPSDAEALSEIKKTMSRELELRKSNSSVEEPLPENAIASEAPTPYMGGVDKQLGMPQGSTTVPSVTSTSVSRATSESRPDVAALDSSPLNQPAPDQKSGFSPSPRVMRNLAESLRTPKPAPSAIEVPAVTEATIAVEAPPTPTPAQKRPEPKRPETKVDTAKETTREQTPAQALATAPTAKENATPSKPPSKAPIVKETPATAGAERAARSKSRASGGTVTTGGFVKPKPRSPTRPIKLPAHLVAPTASSAAKHGDSPPQQRTLSRRSSNISTASRRPSIRPTQHPPMPSRPKHAPPAAAPPTPKSPTTTAPTSFLERMMRPTASSASKVKDKIGDVKGKK